MDDTKITIKIVLACLGVIVKVCQKLTRRCYARHCMALPMLTNL